MLEIFGETSKLIQLIGILRRTSNDWFYFLVKWYGIVL